MNELYALQKKDIPRAREVPTDAFRLDPLWKRLFEGQDKRDLKLSAFFETPIRYCLHYGRVAATSEHLEGVAAWVPGRHAGMSMWRVIRSGATACGMRIGVEVTRKMRPAFTPMERDRREHIKGKEFTYL